MVEVTQTVPALNWAFGYIGFAAGVLVGIMLVLWGFWLLDRKEKK